MDGGKLLVLLLLASFCRYWQKCIRELENAAQRYLLGSAFIPQQKIQHFGHKLPIQSSFFDKFSLFWTQLKIYWRENFLKMNLTVFNTWLILDKWLKLPSYLNLPWTVMFGRFKVVQCCNLKTWRTVVCKFPLKCESINSNQSTECRLKILKILILHCIKGSPQKLGRKLK